MKPGRVVVGQREGESSEAFAARIRARLASTTIEDAWVACVHGDGRSAAARRALVDSVVDHLRNAPASRLVLVAEGHADPNLRTELVMLADRALGHLGTNGGTVSLRFEEARSA